MKRRRVSEIYYYTRQSNFICEISNRAICSMRLMVLSAGEIYFMSTSIMPSRLIADFYTRH